MYTKWPGNTETRIEHITGQLQGCACVDSQGDIGLSSSHMMTGQRPAPALSSYGKLRWTCLNREMLFMPHNEMLPS
jgi:hypothetical protein